MGIFNRLSKRDTNSTADTTSTSGAVNDVLLRAFLSGETITRDKALMIPAVSADKDFISNAIAGMRVKLYKVKKDHVEEVSDDPRVQMLNGDTGDTLDGFQLKKAMVTDYLLGKGGYAYIQKDKNDVTGLFYVSDENVTILKNTDPIHKSFTIQVITKQYKPFEFIKLLRNTKDGASGEGLTTEVSKALETAYSTLLYQLSLVKSGGNKKGFLKSQKKLSPEAMDALKSAWANLYKNNTENIVVLNDGMEFQESSNSSVEMQLDQNKHTLTDEINGIFHVHPDNFDMTFKEAIYPVIRAFETALNRDLLLEKEKKNYYFEFDVKETIRANAKDEAETLKIYKDAGIMTANEIRKRLNLNYIDGLDTINVGLGAVLYDTNTHEYYTPNTNTTKVVDETVEETEETPVEVQEEQFDVNEEQTKGLEEVMEENK